MIDNWHGKMKVITERAIRESKRKSGTLRSKVSILRLASEMRRRRVERFANCF